MYGDLAPSSPAGVPTFGSVPHGVVQDDQKAAVTLDANLQVRRVRCSRGRSTDSAPSRLPVFAGAGASGVPCVAASGRIPVGRPARSRPTRFGISRCRSRTPGLRTKRARPGASSAWLCIRSDGTGAHALGLEGASNRGHCAIGDSVRTRRCHKLETSAPNSSNVARWSSPASLARRLIGLPSSR